MSPFLHGAIIDQGKLSINHFHKATKTKTKFRVMNILNILKEKIKISKMRKMVNKSNT